MAGLALSVPLLTSAGPFSSMYVFGDSLSDTGNTVAVLASQNLGRPFPFAGPYNGGSFSNGPLWVEYLAYGLGLPGTAASFMVGGNNFAFAGARTNQFTSDGLPPLIAQSFGIFGSGGTLPAADPNALYVVVGGGNDVRAVRSGEPGASIGDAISGLTNTIGYLASIGAKNVLVANLPDLGLTPEAALLQLLSGGALPTSASSAATAAFNGALAGAIPLWEGGFNVDINLLDLAGISSYVFNHAATYGFTNTTLPCNGFLGAGGLIYIALDPANVAASQGTSCDASVFSDILHPSARLHAIFGADALALYGIIPEPDSLALFGLALVGLVWSQRRKLVARAV